MSFTVNKFSVLEYSNGFTLWLHKNEDDLATVKEVGVLTKQPTYSRRRYDFSIFYGQ